MYDEQSGGCDVEILQAHYPSKPNQRLIPCGVDLRVYHGPSLVSIGSGQMCIHWMEDDDIWWTLGQVMYVICKGKWENKVLLGPGIEPRSSRLPIHSLASCAIVVIC